MLYRLAYLLTGPSTTAEDLLQGVLERAYVAWPKVQRADQPDAYVRRMLVNASISESRRGYRREFLTTRLPEVPTSDSMVGTVDRATLWPLIRQLPPRQRAVVVLRYYEDLSEAQIAAVLDCAPGTVKAHASAAMRTLRKHLVTPSAPGGVA